MFSAVTGITQYLEIFQWLVSHVFIRQMVDLKISLAAAFLTGEPDLSHLESSLVPPNRTFQIGAVVRPPDILTRDRETAAKDPEREREKQDPAERSHCSNTISRSTRTVKLVPAMSLIVGCRRLFISAKSRPMFPNSEPADCAISCPFDGYPLL
jgi:hypothetical protein